VFRAYHALPPMHTLDGMPCHAAYGFASTLVRMLMQWQPTHFVCAFDAAMTSFRNALEPGYKAGRTEAPEDLEPQFEICEEIARALGLPALSVPDFEADDVIATLAEAVLAAGAQVVVVSTDKDLAQLVREDGSAVFCDFALVLTLDADGVRARFGVAPAQIPDYLALVGDTVDNLPGVAGIGPRTAALLLAKFGRLEEIPDDPGGWREAGVRGAASLAARFSESRGAALRIRELATLRRDAPGMALGPDALIWRGPDQALASDLFERLGWEGIARRVASLAANRSPKGEASG
jgi:DNA polymerase-1